MATSAWMKAVKKNTTPLNFGYSVIENTNLCFEICCPSNQLFIKNLHLGR